MSDEGFLVVHVCFFVVMKRWVFDLICDILIGPSASLLKSPCSEETAPPHFGPASDRDRSSFKSLLVTIFFYLSVETC